MRKLVSVCLIDDIITIEGADSVELAVIGGWTSIVKKGEFSVGEKVGFAEIDSWIPTSIAPFLSKGKEPREYCGIKGERLRSMKMRSSLGGHMSQGLVLPLSVLGDTSESFEVGDDISEVLGVIKYEPPLAACLSGSAKGNFPSEVPKTDQERIQNLKRQFEDWKNKSPALSFEVTEKLDGSSCTMYLDLAGVFHVCSRNLDLREDDTNSFWKAAKKYDVEQKMRDMCLYGIAIQGELIGESIQGNQYKLKGHEYRVFDIYDVNVDSHLDSVSRIKMCADLGLLHAPVIHAETSIPLDMTVQQMLIDAEGTSLLNSSQREGLVWKCIDAPQISFKAISNAWLIKTGG
jgi:RNA ligase (TIGR02306 family)